MFLKPANSNLENGIEKFKMSPEKIHIERKLETGKEINLFERYQNNTTIGAGYLTQKKIIQNCISKRPAFFNLKKCIFWALLSGQGPGFFSGGVWMI